MTIIKVDFDKLDILKSDYSNVSQKFSSVKASAKATESLNGSWGVFLKDIDDLYTQSRNGIMSSFDSTNDIMLKVSSNLNKYISDQRELEHNTSDKIDKLGTELDNISPQRGYYSV